MEFSSAAALYTYVGPSSTVTLVDKYVCLKEVDIRYQCDGYMLY